MLEWMLLPYKRYAEFSGRSRRKEYWLFALFQIILTMVLCVPMIASLGASFAEASAADGGAGTPEFGPMLWVSFGLLMLFSLGSFVPALAAVVRRLHDQDKSGWFILLYLIPYVGPIVILVFLCIEGTKGPNRFGPDPKDPASAAVFA